MLTQSQFVKYLLEGLAVGTVAYYITGKKSLKDSAMLGLTAALVFLLVDLFAPEVSGGLRQGSGFGIGYGMVGGSPTPLPWEFYHPKGERKAGKAPLTEAFESPEQHQQVSADLNKPYKLKDGQYAAKVLLPGYNEDVTPYNSRGCKFESKPETWSVKTGNLDIGSQLGAGNGYQKKNGYRFQIGGDGEEETKEEGAVVAVAAEGAEAAEGTEGASSSPGTFTPQGQNNRQGRVLYSGDIISLVTTDDKYIQRGLVDNQIKFDNPIENVGTNLSKLRFVLTGERHSMNSQTEIKYGDAVYLMHNVYHNNKNEPRYMGYDNIVYSHQIRPSDDELPNQSDPRVLSNYIFKIYDPTDMQLTGPVEFGKEVILAAPWSPIDRETETADMYLKLNSNPGNEENQPPHNSANPKATKTAATRFKIKLVRPYELHDANLSVSGNEVLYP